MMTLNGCDLVSQSGSMITVNGTGFATLAVINFFKRNQKHLNLNPA